MNREPSRPRDETMVEMLHKEVPFVDKYLAASLEAIDKPGGREKNQKNQRDQEILSLPLTCLLTCYFVGTLRLSAVCP
jgi:hypothetical protein